MVTRPLAKWALTLTAVANWARCPVNTAHRIRSHSLCSVDLAFSSVGPRYYVLREGYLCTPTQDLTSPDGFSINHREWNPGPLLWQLLLLPTELNAQSRLHIESDLILSAVLTRLFAQCETAVTVKHQLQLSWVWPKEQEQKHKTTKICQAINRFDWNSYCLFRRVSFLEQCKIF